MRLHIKHLWPVKGEGRISDEDIRFVEINEDLLREGASTLLHPGLYRIEFEEKRPEKINEGVLAGRFGLEKAGAIVPMSYVHLLESEGYIDSVVYILQPCYIEAGSYIANYNYK